MSKKRKKEKQVTAYYTPFGDSVFGMEDMFAQAASAFDIAAIMAIDSGDIEALVQIGNQWTQMALEIAKLKMPEENEQIKVGFGFSCEREVEDNVTNQSISSNNNQSWQFRKRSY